MTLSFPIVPMKAVPGPLPSPTEDGAWAYEVKWDGMRVVAFIAPDGSVRLQSARPAEVTASFPELVGLGAATGGRAAVLDGEVLALDAAGRPSFGRLQQRLGVSDAGEVSRRAAAVPVAFEVFDLLSFDGHDARPLPYRQRRRLLTTAVRPGPAWKVTDAREGDGAALLERVAGLGLEGIVAKRLDSPYTAGRRSPSWRKIKLRARQEFVVGGWSAGQGMRAGSIAALLVGVHDRSGRLRYAGRVGSGLGEAELRLLVAMLTPLARAESPFAGAAGVAMRGRPGPPASPPQWVHPRLVVEVSFAEWPDDGLLRHPVYEGRRFDRDPADVRDERAGGSTPPG